MRLGGRYRRRVASTRQRGRRTQQERTEATTGALVAAARELFAVDGYAATSLDAVVASAQVTKGALYHHFAGKRELFAAVFAQEQERVLAEVAAAYGRHRDPWRAFEAGCQAFLEACLDPGTQRIFLLDATAALGWETIRALESSSLQAMQAALDRAMAAGRLPRRPTAPLAHLLFGAICEGAMVVARAEDRDAAQKAMLSELRRLLRALSA
ncbi:MAG: TetR/AcrR family transcriptional regulator [Solirubrobacterales bacterium]|nr:TetR/AcrR family transcriptional regulator [Solirubrobacterales bacterium]